MRVPSSTPHQSHLFIRSSCVLITSPGFQLRTELIDRRHNAECPRSVPNEIVASATCVAMEPIARPRGCSPLNGPSQRPKEVWQWFAMWFCGSLVCRFSLSSCCICSECSTEHGSTGAMTSLIQPARVESPGELRLPMGISPRAGPHPVFHPMIRTRGRSRA